MNKWNLLKEKCEDKGISIIDIFESKFPLIWVHDPTKLWISEAYKKYNEEILDECLIKIDFKRHYDETV